jgi:hypothetical protein
MQRESLSVSDGQAVDAVTEQTRRGHRATFGNVRDYIVKTEKEHTAG